MRIAVVIASTGRPDSLNSALRHWVSQSSPPARIVLSVVTARDLPDSAGKCALAETVFGPKGLPAQRNSALRHLGNSCEIVAFFDDDYIPSKYCLDGIARFFEKYPDVVAANGRVLADGINTPGISTVEAEQIVQDFDRDPTAPVEITKQLRGLYGCNMVYRQSALQDLWFDERLKLYGWQEDIDFASQVSRRGQVVKTLAFAGVHQGVKGGRTSGVRLGYSQVVNPLYLVRKGTMAAPYAGKIVAKNLVANHLRALWPEPWVDRLGRVKGNWLGFLDVCRGRLTPERIEML
jgi:GT2 family glycosyltransferase